MSSPKNENWKKFFKEKTSRIIPKNFEKKLMRENLYRLEKIQEFLLLEKKFYSSLQKDKNNFHSNILKIFFIKNCNFQLEKINYD